MVSKEFIRRIKIESWPIKLSNLKKKKIRAYVSCKVMKKEHIYL